MLSEPSWQIDYEPVKYANTGMAVEPLLPCNNVTCPFNCLLLHLTALVDKGKAEPCSIVSEYLTDVNKNEYGPLCNAGLQGMQDDMPALKSCSHWKDLGEILSNPPPSRK